MAKAKPTYQELSAELEHIVSDLQQDTVDIDTALAQYQRGLQLVKELETYLQNASNTIQELKASLSKAEQ